MPRLILGWVLCCSFFGAQAHVQRQRLLRAQDLTPAPVSQAEQGQRLPLADHLGCSTTRALKASTALALLEESSLGVPAQSRPVASSKGLVAPTGRMAPPSPMRAVESPPLRI
jgi:hypothetical protein